MFSLRISSSHMADLSTSPLRPTPSFTLRRAAYCWKSSIIFFSATNAFDPVIKPLRTYVFITHTWQSHVSESTSCHPYNLPFSIFLHLVWQICPPHLWDLHRRLSWEGRHIVGKVQSVPFRQQTYSSHSTHMCSLCTHDRVMHWKTDHASRMIYLSPFFSISGGRFVHLLSEAYIFVWAEKNSMFIFMEPGTFILK